MQYQIDTFIASLNQFWLQLVNFVPKLLAVMVILFLGWISCQTCQKSRKTWLGACAV